MCFKVFQRRWNGFIAFNRSFADYEKGFGSLDGEFWTGLGLLHSMTSRANMTLRVEMSSPDGITGFDEYAGFYISPPERYIFNVDRRINSEGMSDSFLLSDNDNAWSIINQPFSTYDRDVDNSPNNCAQQFGRGKSLKSGMRIGSPFRCACLVRPRGHLLNSRIGHAHYHRHLTWCGNNMAVAEMFLARINALAEKKANQNYLQTNTAEIELNLCYMQYIDQYIDINQDSVCMISKDTELRYDYGVADVPWRKRK
ncbi:MFAP4-like protein, partial [Mya arenaria]